MVEPTDARVAEFVEIAFYIDHPSAEVEFLWGEPLGSDRFKIVTVPSFALGVAAGNVVRARRNEHELAFEATLEESGHSTVWASLDATVDERAFSRLLTGVGCGCFPRYGNGEFCIDVPPSVAWGPVAAALESERAIDVEVAFRSKRHSDQPTGDESERAAS